MNAVNTSIHLGQNFVSRHKNSFDSVHKLKDKEYCHPPPLCKQALLNYTSSGLEQSQEIHLLQLSRIKVKAANCKDSPKTRRVIRDWRKSYKVAGSVMKTQLPNVPSKAYFPLKKLWNAHFKNIYISPSLAFWHLQSWQMLRLIRFVIAHYNATIDPKSCMGWTLNPWGRKKPSLWQLYLQD